MKSRTRKADRTLPECEIDEEVYKQETKQPCRRVPNSDTNKLHQSIEVSLSALTDSDALFFLSISPTSRKPRNMGMPWAYVTKGPADTVRNSALIDEIFRKVR